MNNRRPLHLAILVAIACLFAFQSAGAVITSGYIEDFSETQVAAETCTDMGYLMLSPGLGVGSASFALFSVPPCYVLEGADPLGPAAQASADICTVGPVNTFLAPAGPGIEGSLMDYVGAPLCDMPVTTVTALAGPGIEGSIAEYVVPPASDTRVSTFQPADAQDARVCDANAADLKHTEPCYKAD